MTEEKLPKFKCFNDFLLIKRDEIKATEGGILIAEEYQKSQGRGTVIAVGPGNICPADGQRVAIRAEPGDTVMLGNWGVIETAFERGGEVFAFVREKDVFGVVEDA